MTNVVIVVADDLGWGDTGCYGAEAIPTPTIDGLARRGLRFTDAHSTSAVCTPSRYSLMTGCYPWRSPLKKGVLGGFDPPLIEQDRLTLGQAFRQRDYATGFFGKWHLGLGWSRTDGTKRDAFTEPRLRGDTADEGLDIDYGRGFTDGPTDRGFDRFFGIAGSLDMAPYCFLSQDQVVGIPNVHKDVSSAGTGQRPGLTVEGWRDDQVDLTITGEATSWIREQREQQQPFLAVLAAMSPHRPCDPPARFRDASGVGRRGDAVVLVDHLVGQVLDAVGDAIDDTIIVFTSDNGAPMNYPDDGDTFHHRPNGGWRGQKADIWEAGHRVPLIISGPDIRSGTCQATVSLMDLLPTLIDRMTGAPTSESIDGRSFADLLAEPATDSDPRLLGLQALNGMLALRHGSRVAIFGTGSGGFTELPGAPSWDRDSRGQLYDLADDPGELRNRWTQATPEPWEWLDRFVEETGFDPTTDGDIL